MGKIGHEELRRSTRVRVCCRVDVHQRHGVWTAVTQDLSPRGCRIASPQLPRLGSRLQLTLSSDLFPEELSTVGEVVWVSGEELGILFVDEPSRRDGALSPAEWVRRVLEYGEADEGDDAPGRRVVPAVSAAREAIPFRSRRRSG